MAESASRSLCSSNSMLLCPLAIHTSPTMTLKYLSVTLVRSEMVSVYGPPASSGGSVTIQVPSGAIDPMVLTLSVMERDD